jgi:hypothetical protein
MFWMSLSSIFKISPPKVIGCQLMLVVLSPPTMPAFLAGVDIATSITKKPLDI